MNGSHFVSPHRIQGAFLKLPVYDTESVSPGRFGTSSLHEDLVVVVSLDFVFVWQYDDVSLIYFQIQMLRGYIISYKTKLVDYNIL